MPVNLEDGYLDSRIVFTRPDGGVTIRLFRPEKLVPVTINPATGDAVKGAPLTEEAFFAAELAKTAASPKCADTPHVVSKADLPENYEFRDAWEHDGAGKVTVNLEKCKAIQAERASRAADIAARRASSPSDKATARALSENLNLSAAQTPEDVAVAWPAALTKVDIRPAKAKP